MRIVLDPNLLVRTAMRTSELARELLLQCTEDPHVVAISEFILSEVSRVLRYPRMRQFHGLGDEDVEVITDVELMRRLREGTER
jgi:predicted nucleic acid-binding protein